MAPEADVAVAGLAVMGQNLARNLASKGSSVAVFNRTRARTDHFIAGYGGEGRFLAAASGRELVAALRRPRRIILMVKAGEPVDETIAELAPLLDPGDVLMDGGNSFFRDTERRGAELAQREILFLGAGISGGEEGALHGPSIMPGGPRAAWEAMAPLLTAIAARHGGDPCCAYIGPGGAGHYVKMVHNGIEYADMQLIAEAYDLLRRVLELDAGELAAVFSDWNQGDLDSYLIQITSAVLRKRDPETGGPLVDLIRDEAGQKGTGRWGSESALELGVPATAIAEAVFARYLSALRERRLRAAQLLPGPAAAKPDPDGLVDAVRDALYASKVIAYAQGFDQMLAASRAFGWNLDLGALAAIWRAGCIIRARFLDRITDAYREQPDLESLLFAPYFVDALERTQGSWRRVVALAMEQGVPVPAFSSALAYFDGFRSSRLPANLIQGLRDYFGAHTYQRLDREGSFHTEWGES
jgi:6-phosphogluconate dehydrogenase